MIKITHGSIFDHKCDLLIIPTSDTGSITTSVYKELNGRDLPVDISGIPYGSAHFRSVHYENASTLAYVASVNSKTRKSESSAIRNIAKEIVSYCSKNGVGLVNVPLIGTGAGGMTPAESFEVLKKQFKGDDKTTYVIYCLSSEILKDIEARLDADVDLQEYANPRVFVSYAGNDKENAAWSKELATRLRDCGVDARLDKFHLKPGYDLPQWMTNEVIMAEKVLLVCDSHYMEKADFRKGGVGWETMIIQGDMLAQGDAKSKYIAIIREEVVEKALPIYLRSKYALNWGKKKIIDEKEFEELVLLLYDRDSEPPLGKVPHYVKKLKKIGK